VDMASVMAYFQSRDRENDDRIARLEQMMLDQRQSMRHNTVSHPSHRRESMGESLRVPVAVLSSPAPVQETRAMDPFSTPGPTDQGGVGHAGRVHGARVPTDDEMFERALRTIRSYVPMFHADSQKDKGTTVDDFVVKVESAMADILRDHPQIRLSIVRMCLQEGALRWLNRHIERLRDQGIHDPQWDRDVRTAFIDAHNRVNTPQLWRIKLRALRLGKGATPSPIELDNQFDTIARHLLPDGVEEGAINFFLASEYGDIIKSSNFTLYSEILKTTPHSTLEEWKAAVARQWSAAEELKSEEQRNTSHGDHRYGRGTSNGNGGGRGGHWRQGGSRSGATVRAMGVEGEEMTVEGEPSEGAQVNAMTGPGSQRGGGGGGRGGRGRVGSGGGGRVPMTAEQLKQWRSTQVCYQCGRVGHIARECGVGQGNA
jgi:hypothetical protein